MTWKYKENEYRIIADDNIETPFVSSNSILSDLKNNHLVLAIVTAPTSESEESPEKHPKEIQSTLNRYRDVFPEKLHKGLPPKRKYDFKIEQQDGTQPQMKGLYRLSDNELEELKKQLDDLFQSEFIRPRKSPWGSPIFFVSKKGQAVKNVR